jgi:hypothetical protein
MARPIMPCPKCRQRRRMTNHHVRPVRWFGRKNNNLTIFLCRACHDALELRIPYELLPEEQYIRILLRFLEEEIP